MKEVIDTLARLETKVDDLRSQKKDHETRIRSLEGWRWLVVGGSIVTVFVIESAIRLVK